MAEAFALLALGFGVLVLFFLRSRDEARPPPPPIDIQEAWRRRQKRRHGP
jgi:hypothetical protein